MESEVHEARGHQTFWKCVKKMFFLVKSAYFQQKLPFLAQRHFKHLVKLAQAKNP